ncbi:hypothetical protein EST62_13250 [Chlorobaculum sp. 24CR]|uniref:hypothetical protein n=1 Tax=Chlorobaculum sp. 24CR TaxID=2508878 RepID=UPI00100AFF88|nr:hypothetical protein [Chlorobaculum sp. 24CR]RXK79850.1 hypothetical protein EST62_13250 [Chlorobaculum sp. 24CR]
MNHFPCEHQNDGAIIKKTAEPAPVPTIVQEQQDHASRKWYQTLWDKVKGYTATDALRLKEAGIQTAEGEAAQRVNNAKKIEAEAQLLHAEADLKRQEAALKEIEWRSALNNLQNSQVKEEIENTERQAAALERLANAISAIRQKGGDIGFDPNQLVNAIKTLEEKMK